SGLLPSLMRRSSQSSGPSMLSSSLWKSARLSNQRPASSTTTLSPALARLQARVLPAAPEPTITTSTGPLCCCIVSRISFIYCSLQRCPAGGPLVALLRGGQAEPAVPAGEGVARKADAHPDARVREIAAQHAGQQPLEEVLRRDLLPGLACGAALLHC